jgi:AraC family transcriptional regulator
MGPQWTVAQQKITSIASIQLCTGFFPTPGQSLIQECAPTLSFNLTRLQDEKRGRFSDVTDSDYLPMGDVLFQPADSELHSKGAGGEQNFIRVIFHPAALEEAINLAPDYSAPSMQRRLMHVRSPAVEQGMRRVFSELTAPGMASDFLLDAYAAMLSVELTRYFAEAGPADARPIGGLAPWQVRRITERVRDETLAPPTVVELSGLVRLSPRHLARAYRTSTGETISDAVEAARQVRAERLILQGERPLKDIARLLGFASASSFSTAFRRRAGCSPQEFARRKP